MVDEKPPMPDSLRPLAEAAIKRHQKRAAPPPVVSKPEHGYYQNLTCPYRDEDQDLWRALLLEAFGTRVYEVAQHFFRQLEALVPLVLYEGEEHSRRDEEAMRTALAIVCSLKPRNEAEAAAAAQFVALHFMTMKVGARALKYDYLDIRTAGTLAALAKASASHLALLRGDGGRKRETKQTIRVERVYIDNRQQHLHAGEGGRESGSQPQGGSGQRARGGHDLRSEGENDGNLLSLPCREGPEPLPIPRRRGGLGGA